MHSYMCICKYAMSELFSSGPDEYTKFIRVSDDDAGGGGKNAKIVSKLSPEHD